MPRTTKSVTAKSKHKKFSSTKGHYGAEVDFINAKQSNIKSLQYAFRDRKTEKTLDLWIAKLMLEQRIRHLL